MLRLLSKFADNVYRQHVGVASFLVEPGGMSASFRRKNAHPSYTSFDSLHEATQSDDSVLKSGLDGALCRIAVSDTDFYFHLTRFTHLPSKADAARKFLEWRLREELGDVQRDCEVAFGASDVDKGLCPTLLCRANRKAELIDSLVAAGARPEHYLPTSFYILAYLSSSHLSERGTCFPLALAILWSHEWTFIVTDTDGAIIHMRSCRWVSDQGIEDELTELCSDWARTLRCCKENRIPQLITVMGDAGLCDQLKRVAEMRDQPVALRDECVFASNESAERQKFLLDVVANYVE